MKADFRDENRESRQIQEKESFEHTIQMLRYSEYRAASISKQLSKLSSSKSWKLTLPLRKTNSKTRKLLQKAKRLFDPAKDVDAKLLKQAGDLISESGLFDEQYYNEQLKEKSIQVEDSLTHFILDGWKQNLNPNHFFDCAYYIAQAKQMNVGVNINPLLHYLIEGSRSRIPTCKFFDPSLYCSLYPDVRTLDIDPLSHFLQIGLQEGRLANRSIIAIDSLRKNLQADPSNNLILKQGSKSPQPYDYIVLIHQANLSGAPMVGLALLQTLVKKGYNCLTIILKSGELDSEFNAVSDVIKLSMAPNSDEILSEQLELLESQKLLEKAPPVFSVSAENYRIQFALKKRGLKTIALIHEFTSNYPDWIREEIAANSDMLIFSNRAALDDISWTREHDVPLHILPQGSISSDFDVCDKKQGKEFLLSQYGINPRDFVVLACASIERRKGTDLFIRVASQLYLSAESDPHIHFVWVGDAKPGDDFLQWAKIDLANLGIENRVTFTGVHRDLKQFFSAADVFLLPSRQDPMPCVLHLAMMAKLPVLAFKNSGGAEEVLSKGGGKIVNYGDTIAMAKQILTYKSEPALAERDGAHGRKIVEESYRIDAYVDELLKLTESLNREPQDHEVS